MTDNQIETVAKDLHEIDATMCDACGYPVKEWNDLTEEGREAWRQRAREHIAERASRP